MMHTSNAGIFFIQALFSLVILLVLLRFLLQLMRVDYYNPISKMVTRFSDPLLGPLRRLLPVTRRIDGASLLALFLLQYLQIVMIAGIRGLAVDPVALSLLAVAEILSLIVSILFWAILILAVLSWFQPSTHHPGVALLQQLTDPLIEPVRRWVPPSGGVDFSPIVALMALKLAEFIVIAPLKDIVSMMLGR